MTPDMAATAATSIGGMKWPMAACMRNITVHSAIGSATISKIFSESFISIVVYPLR